MGKITREEIRHDLEEDVVANTVQDFLKWLQRNQNRIIIVVVALLVVWGASKMIGAYRQRVVAEANLSLSEAQQLFYQAVTNEDAAARNDLAARSLSELDQVAQVFSGDPLGRRALYLSGVYEFRLLNFAKARERFEKYRDSAKDKIDRARGALAVGTCFENESFIDGDESLLKNAEEAYQQAIDLGGSSYVRYQAMIAQARLLGQDEATRDKAIEMLEKVISQRQELVEQATPGKKDEAELTDREKELERFDAPGLVGEAEDLVKTLKSLGK